MAPLETYLFNTALLVAAVVGFLQIVDIFK
jgi:hypothetical protein